MRKLSTGATKRAAVKVGYGFMDMLGFGFAKDVFDELRRAPIDERLAKIEEAKHNLTDALTAIEDMQADAQERQRSLKMLTSKIERARSEKTGVEKELEALETLARLDPQGVRKVFRIPTTFQVWAGRLISFVLGVVASLVASWIWTAYGSH
ncbi:hypothetical protein JF546_19045 [Nitratireductor aquimarinus]|uniref:hypothetical protein n=1 Tax=Nitratireductor TaxID=245876 RepID=UPI001A9070C7|nr:MULTISPECIES: hypothetical protein [Nitratireductor]MBN8245119.1 hypothetical protein [Nitratireductor aquimarinus]MBY6133504.1 hypothetical protein [Nitratireductor aquimarinus]MCA1304845.1 hypothetical protein [Nitratireductor aquimarinus]MCV0350225.1 hypothetical protein [Nitratireductor sp.]